MSDVPRDVFQRVHAHCMALPDATLRSDPLSHVFEVRRRVFTYLATIDGVTFLSLDADDDERRALLATGHPYFRPGSGRRRLGIVVDDASDWDEIIELITDSFRLVAPKKLSALLDD